MHKKLTSHDVTEHRVALVFLLPSRKHPIQTFNMLDKEENMLKDRPAFLYKWRRGFWMVKTLYGMIDDLGASEL